MTEIVKLIRALQRATKNLETATVEVPDIPDATGDIRAVEIKLQELRWEWNQLAVVEAKDPESPLGPETLGSQEPEPGDFGGRVTPRVTGQRYRTVEKSGPTKRSYNTAAILRGIADAEPLADEMSAGAHEGPLDALMWAIEQKIAEIKWKWTPLQKAAKALGLPMRVVKHSIADDGDIEGAWVGEEHSTKITQEPIPGEGKEQK